MKLIIITAVREFEKDVKQILKNSGVVSYSYQYVMGHSNAAAEEETNWFGSHIPETESVMFYAFVKAENINKTCDAVKEFNEKQETLSKIHTAIVKLEK